MLKIVLIVIFTIFVGAKEIGVVFELEGEVFALRGDKKIELSPFNPIFQNDKVKTSKASYIKIQLKDDSLITIGENSTFDFSTYNITNNLKKRDFFAKLNHSLQKIAPERFTLDAKTSVSGFRAPPPKKDNLKKDLIKRCKKNKLPTIGKFLKEDGSKSVYKVQKSQSEILNFFMNSLPKEIVITNLALLPNNSGFIIYLKDLKEFSSYEIRFLKKEKKLIFNCK